MGKKKDMKQIKLWMIAAIFICGTISLTSCSYKADEVETYNTSLRAIITGMDYGDNVLVVGHKSPDTEAVCSAMTYASLLQRMGINAEARVAGKVFCEPHYVLKEAGIATPTIQDNAKGLNMIMMDHSVFASDELPVEELCRRMRQVMPTVREQRGLNMLFMMLGDRKAQFVPAIPARSTC